MQTIFTYLAFSTKKTKMIMNQVNIRIRTIQNEKTIYKLIQMV